MNTTGEVKSMYEYKYSISSSIDLLVLYPTILEVSLNQPLALFAIKLTLDGFNPNT